MLNPNRERESVRLSTMADPRRRPTRMARCQKHLRGQTKRQRNVRLDFFRLSFRSQQGRAAYPQVRIVPNYVFFPLFLYSKWSISMIFLLLLDSFRSIHRFLSWLQELGPKSRKYCFGKHWFNFHVDEFRVCCEGRGEPIHVRWGWACAEKF